MTTTMAPRRRDHSNRHLEGTNIKPIHRGGKTYYYYIMPDGHLEPLAHGDEKTSIEAAHILNQRLRPAGNVVDRILNNPRPAPRPAEKNPPMVQVIDEFEREWLPKQGYSARSLSERKQKLRRWETRWPHQRIGATDTFTIAQFLRTLSHEAARQHRILLDQFFRYAASSGYATQRPMVDIEKTKQQPRQRVRHNWKGYKAIYEASPPWLQRAQRDALYTLQRRSDLVAIRFDQHIDLKNRTIRVLQQKSRNYDEPVYIDIAMGDELYDSIMESHWSGINCPYLVHCQPGRMTKLQREAKPHPFAVLPDYLSRKYSEVRDRVGVYNHLPKARRPGIHSLRALGIWLYTKAGYDDDYIMALAGHASEKMKAHYTEGHEKVPPVQVEAGLSLSAVDLTDIDWETDLSKDLLEIADGGE